MAAPMIVYGIIVIARFGISVAALNQKQNKNRNLEGSVFMSNGGPVYHEYC